jgi:hypothetical protein
MVDDGPDRGTTKYLPVPISIRFFRGCFIDWQAVKMNIYYLLERLQSPTEARRVFTTFARTE